MTINNQYKPMNVQKPVQEQTKRVGSNYSERKQLSSNQPSFTETARSTTSRDNFGTRPSSAENFARDDKYSTTKLKTPLFKRLENGRLPQAASENASPKVTDDMRLAFLDKIISSGKPVAKIPVKSTIKQIKA